ncbi:substrate-binding periplasmic protein [Rugamonas rubra]|nr:amino acid ABC transporter substrate-binding protein [Rugamonas rubra]
MPAPSMFRSLLSLPPLLAALLAWAPPATAAPAAAPLRIVLPPLHPSAREHAAYFPALLRLALEKTRASDGPFEISVFPRELTSPRQALELKNNGVINVIWDGSNAQRERELLAVPVSLLGELNDYRVLLIRRQDASRFAAVRTLEQLAALRAGAGVNWPSTEILRANGLPVVTAISYEFLFPMLQGGRFDYLPRGVYEAWFEQRVHAGRDLVVEPDIFLHYRVPFHFFVSRDNPALAARIERGLRLAQQDGSFARLFNGVPAFRRSLDEIRAGKRRVFELRPLP